MKTYYKKGFTLIELLIVMMIIAILVGISVVALGGARKTARDAKRKSDLESIRAAIEIYRADCNEYPTTLSSPLQRNCTGAVNTYIQTVPLDPSGGNYYYSATTSTYRICAELEDPGTSMTCSGCASCNYRVGSP